VAQMHHVGAGPGGDSDEAVAVADNIVVQADGGWAGGRGDDHHRLNNHLGRGLPDDLGRRSVGYVADTDGHASVDVRGVDEVVNLDERLGADAELGGHN